MANGRLVSLEQRSAAVNTTEWCLPSLLSVRTSAHDVWVALCDIAQLWPSGAVLSYNLASVIKMISVHRHVQHAEQTVMTCWLLDVFMSH